MGVPNNFDDDERLNLAGNQQSPSSTSTSSSSGLKLLHLQFCIFNLKNKEKTDIYLMIGLSVPRARLGLFNVGHYLSNMQSVKDNACLFVETTRTASPITISLPVYS